MNLFFAGPMVETTYAAMLLYLNLLQDQDDIKVRQTN